MGLSKTEVNLRRLLAAAPQQQNRVKLVHYVTTLRELLEQVETESASGLSSVSKAKLSEYSEKIEALAAKLANDMSEPVEGVDEIKVEESPSNIEQNGNYGSPPTGLRRRFAGHTEIEDNASGTTDKDSSVKLDSAGQAHIEKHRKLQEDLTDEMVILARQLKESSLVMSQSLQDTEKILDSTERAVEHSLANTGRANAQAMEVNSESFKTTCFTWLIMLVMICVFIMVVLLIRIT